MVLEAIVTFTKATVPDINNCYINNSEIPGELLQVNMISSHVKITCYFTCENNMLFSQTKRFPMLWLHNPLDLLLHDRNIIGSSSEIFSYLRKSSQIFGNFQKMFGNIRLAFGQLLKTTSEIFGKCSEIFGKSC